MYVASDILDTLNVGKADLRANDGPHAVVLGRNHAHSSDKRGSKTSWSAADLKINAQMVHFVHDHVHALGKLMGSEDERHNSHRVEVKLGGVLVGVGAVDKLGRTGVRDGQTLEVVCLGPPHRVGVDVGRQVSVAQQHVGIKLVGLLRTVSSDRGFERVFSAFKLTHGVARGDGNKGVSVEHGGRFGLNGSGGLGRRQFIFGGSVTDDDQWSRMGGNEDTLVSD